MKPSLSKELRKIFLKKKKGSKIDYGKLTAEAINKEVSQKTA